MPAGKTVNNINDYRLECSKSSDNANTNGDMVTSPSTSKDVDLQT